MRISAYTYSTTIGQTDWSSCRYTKGEGFDLLDNTSGVFVTFVRVYSDDPSLKGADVKMDIERVRRPELDYLIDVNAVKESDIPEVDEDRMSFSRRESELYIRRNSLSGAEIVKEKDDSFVLCESRVILEAFSEIAQ